MKRIRHIFVAAAAIAALVSAHAMAAGADAPASSNRAALRPPAVPLVTSDPYLSIWSDADHLTDDVTRHWTKRPNSLVSLIRIDDKPYRLMGNDPKSMPAFPQVSLEVLPTRSIYQFDDGHVHLTLTFMTAALPHDLEALSRPLSYLTWDVKSVDGGNHKVAIYDSASSQLAVNKPSQQVEWARETAGDLTALRVGTKDQPYLTPPGDDTRIDWGYAYLAAPTAQIKSAIGANDELIKSFAQTGELPAKDDDRMPRATTDEQPVLAIAFDLGNVGAAPVSRHAMVAYDEIWSIKYYSKKLPPYWRRNGATPAEMLQAADHDYPNLVKRCTQFDDALMADMTKEGGARYAQIAALAYRQCLAACGLAADANKQPLLFTKENTSNGDIATVDVIFPMEPMLLFLSPTLTKASLVAVLDYSASPHWKFPNAPHDLGTYPVIMGRDDGGEGMPVEESGNMLILLDALAQSEGNADFAGKWWPQLTQWAVYLEKYGLDPEEQLCTDDFMGHLAHNANLSVKAILGLAAYGDLCKMRGDNANAKKYMDLAKADAAHWVKAANDGDHSRLAFDKPGTWSQKYNLVWDKLLNLNVFPPSVAKQEVAHYKSVMQKYGVPLDSRTKLTKTDWSLWSATLADNQADFEAIVSPIYDYLNHTSARSPLVDSYITTNIKSDGMHARPVVGGIFIKMLEDRAMWKKWAGGDHAKVGNWAPLPPKPLVSMVVPTSRRKPAIWKYTVQKPSADWTKPDFDDSGWKQGPGALGTKGTPNIPVRTIWNTDDIWMRREITLPDKMDANNLQFWCIHDEDVQIYVNGILAATDGGFVTEYVPLDIAAPARALLKPAAKVTLALHVHQTQGGQGIDVGLANVTEQ
ncbi:MAG TPA: DUF5127 domain-containing protein [Tepidisphaeraceae bacterium]|nr:DUF5127 domain-containing protein [Tepidisphaeraceae bacterium]